MPHDFTRGVGVSKRRDPVKGLGHSQVLILRLLASIGEASAAELERNWPGLTESAARNAVLRLGDRGLVDLAGWDWDGAGRGHGQRTYSLTERGREVEAKLLEEGET